MLKKRISVILVIGLVAIASRSPCAFAQGREYLRTRSGSLAAEEALNAEEEASSVKYFIAPNDEIDIFVWKNPELSKTIIIGPDGQISYPLIGRMQVSGLTTSQVEDKIREKLADQAEFIFPEDEIEIFFWENPYLTKTVTVEADGRISCPLIGRMQVSGLTISQLEDKIREKLAEKAKFISPEDEIEVFVWQNADLSKTIIVGSDGQMSYPLIGRMQVSGLTISQLEEQITEKLSEYIKRPQVLAMMKKFASRISVTRKKYTGQVSVMMQKYAGNKIVILVR